MRQARTWTNSCSAPGYAFRSSFGIKTDTGRIMRLDELTALVETFRFWYEHEIWLQVARY